MTALEHAPRTNGDMVQPFVDRAKTGVLAAIGHFREHPDEAAVALAPFLMLFAATRRHKLNPAEAFLISEVGWWAGVLAFDAYRNWKTKPAAPGPRLRKVT